MLIERYILERLSELPIKICCTRQLKKSDLKIVDLEIILFLKMFYFETLLF